MTSLTVTRPFAPYAPILNVVEFIHTVRDRDMPQPVTPATLQAIGIPEGNAPRTLQALKFLHVLQEDGFYDAAAQRLKLAGTDEYPEILAELVRDAYQLVFKVVDPASDPEYRIADAFRQYQPDGQRSRMVTLFMGLCAEAGIVTRAGRAPSRDTKRTDRTPKQLRSAARERLSREVSSVQPTTTGSLPGVAMLFGVTEEDIAELDEGQFQDVWTALGTVARARANARKRAAEQQAAASREFWNPFGSPAQPKEEKADEDASDTAEE
jgi:hypothetical protein